MIDKEDLAIENVYINKYVYIYIYVKSLVAPQAITQGNIFILVCC